MSMGRTGGELQETPKDRMNSNLLRGRTPGWVEPAFGC